MLQAKSNAVMARIGLCAGDSCTTLHTSVQYAVHMAQTISVLHRQAVFVVQAMAAHNSGGVVIVQVERLVDRGTMNTRLAHIPGAIVDKIVLAPAENHWMHLGSPIYDGSLSGGIQRHSTS